MDKQDREEYKYFLDYENMFWSLSRELTKLKLKTGAVLSEILPDSKKDIKALRNIGEKLKSQVLLAQVGNSEKAYEVLEEGLKKEIESHEIMLENIDAFILEINKVKLKVLNKEKLTDEEKDFKKSLKKAHSDMTESVGKFDSRFQTLFEQVEKFQKIVQNSRKNFKNFTTDTGKQDN